MKQIIKEIIIESSRINGKPHRVISKELKSDLHTVIKALTNMREIYSNIGFSEYGKQIAAMEIQIIKLYQRWEQNAKGFGNKL